VQACSTAVQPKKDPSRGPRDGILSVLYSDVGYFYSRSRSSVTGSGRIIQSPREVVWPSTIVIESSSACPIGEGDFTMLAKLDGRINQVEMLLCQRVNRPFPHSRSPSAPERPDGSGDLKSGIQSNTRSS